MSTRICHSVYINFDLTFVVFFTISFIEIPSKFHRFYHIHLILYRDEIHGLCVGLEIIVINKMKYYNFIKRLSLLFCVFFLYFETTQHFLLGFQWHFCVVCFSLLAIFCIDCILVLFPFKYRRFTFRNVHQKQCIQIIILLEW